jgi:hypothetical protein
LRGRGFPNIAACRAQACLPDSASVAEVLNSSEVRAAIAQGLARLRAQGGGSSTFATRALLLSEPSSVDGGEITDKGYINQRDDFSMCVFPHPRGQTIHTVSSRSSPQLIAQHGEIK